ncbi:phosphotransferase [Candidatus Halobeggiatoa sp. HSG11]|nr:phosphotransferase [Candidatus Halobeggiatoa sp. HSG11]
MPERIKTLQNWLQTELNIPEPQLVAITNDASFRRYFRVVVNGVEHIVMDAPPDKEDCQPFVNISQCLATSGLNVPKILASDLTQGFLLLTDLGSELYLPNLTKEQADYLYKDALKALVTMQVKTSSNNLPTYNYNLLCNEMNLFTDWLVKQHLNLSLSETQQVELATCFEILIESALSQPQVFVHRDYHSRNLMIVPKNNPGIIDFQDAVIGPITYDLVSLLRDCYISWPQKQLHGWLEYYYILIYQNNMLKSINKDNFLRWFDLMGIQRHLKASGIFARLYHRDGKSGYLKDIPRTLNYIVEVSAKYPELKYLHKLVSEQVLPKFLSFKPDLK